MKNRNARILVIDDDEKTREIMRLILEKKGYETVEAESGESALEAMKAELPDLILLDVEMPGISGFEVVKRLKADSRTRTIPVIMVTGLGDQSSRLEALANGAEDYLPKPVDPTELWMRVRNHLRLKEYGDFLASLNSVLETKVRERTAQLEENYRETIYLLTSAAELRDETTGAHVRRISHYASRLARAMKADSEFVEAIFYASPMHDIGKIGIPDHILLKRGPLTSEEWITMKKHAEIGAKILETGSSPYMKMGALIALTHHECWDGSGYPSGIKGEEIPLPGRIMLLCDQYDALRGQRLYKPPLDHHAVMKILTEGDGPTRPEQFYPEVLDAFESCKDDFERIYSLPVGSVAGSEQIGTNL
ncbi:MAG: HD domain-containing phosphohydrolase [Spirochaetia bacterium]